MQRTLKSKQQEKPIEEKTKELWPHKCHIRCCEGEEWKGFSLSPSNWEILTSTPGATDSLSVILQAASTVDSGDSVLPGALPGSRVFVTILDIRVKDLRWRHDTVSDVGTHAVLFLLTRCLAP